MRYGTHEAYFTCEIYWIFIYKGMIIHTAFRRFTRREVSFKEMDTTWRFADGGIFLSLQFQFTENIQAKLSVGKRGLRVLGWTCFSPERNLTRNADVDKNESVKFLKTTSAKLWPFQKYNL